MNINYHQYFESSSIHALLQLLVKRFDVFTRNREFQSLSHSLKKGLDNGDIDVFMNQLSQHINYYDPNTSKQYTLDQNNTIYEILVHIQKEASRIDLLCAYAAFDGLAKVVESLLSQTVKEYPEKIDIYNAILFEYIDLYLLESVMSDHQFVVKYCKHEKMKSIYEMVTNSNISEPLIVKACLDEMLKISDHIDKR